MPAPNAAEGDAPRWGVADLLLWKLVPQRLGGGRPYIQRYKDAWVRHHRATIRREGGRFGLPAPMLAGVCWIEVGGDPTFIDSVALAVRNFDWSGPDWVDRHMTITSPPAKTSFGAVSIQLRTAAQTLGRDPAKMSSGELMALATLLEKDADNIAIVARHLGQLARHDGLARALALGDPQAIRVVGARYNRGVGLSIEQIRRNTSYGDFIVRFWPRFVSLVA